ncbi:MAG: anthranilate synthase component I [Syntrophomonas sp.]
MSPLSKNTSEFSSSSYTSLEGIRINRIVEPLDVAGATDNIMKHIDYRKGALFSSSYDYPGRYTQWDIGFIDPCLEIRARERNFQIEALNKNGLNILPDIKNKLASLPELAELKSSHNKITGSINPGSGYFPEEERSRQPTVFSVIRALKELFASPQDHFLGLYGAFGYDLVFQFEPLELKHTRPEEAADLVLYMPDNIIVVDHRMERAYQLKYDFENPLPVEEMFIPELSSKKSFPNADPLPHVQPGKYAGVVRKAKDFFARGDLFEVVPSHSLFEPCPYLPSQVFTCLKSINPSPYGFIINLGNEYLVGASPEMYVRVEGARVETCPISGTIKRGQDAIEDAVQIRKLLNSYKDEAELTMCTDVDRNDKSRICVPGSVKVIGRRQIEMYSHLIHTVDHVEGRLRPEFDSLDAFLTHMWAVTVTGAPKRAAIKWLEENEDSPRAWYGGAVGYLSFSGDLNTGLTLRTVRIKDGVAEIRVGATLLYDSVPEDEEAETMVKAAALVKAIRSCGEGAVPTSTAQESLPARKKVLLVDHEDSFVHTLANYFRQCGAEVTVARGPLARKLLQDEESYNLLILSPGPGKPDEFHLDQTIRLAMERQIPLFGVCLGLQGIVESFGGQLGQLPQPWHGKPSLIRICNSSQMWDGLPQEFHGGRYHSLFAQSVPECLRVTAVSQDGVAMAIEHRELPIRAVQFHPESIMTSGEGLGLKLLQNVLNQV